jgi:hypothetical protein
MTRVSLLLTVSLSGLALAATACGDDDNRSLSYDDTGKELAAICREYDTASEEEKLTGGVEADEPVLREVTDRTEAGLAEIRDLDVHEDLASARDDFVAAVEQSIERGEVLLKLATDGEQNAYLKQIREYQLSAGAIASRTGKLASKLGAPACGQNR